MSGGEICLNRLTDRGAVYGPEQSAILSDAAFSEAYSTVSSWPGYGPTTLVSLDGLADHAGLGSIRYKDEASRFGLGSFKALGGAYAVWRVLARAASVAGVSPADEQAFSDLAAGITVCCATDGNHGRSVAWGAQNFGCHCVIFIHETVSEGRKAAIEAFGAQVVRCRGNYDDSVREAQAQATANGWTVVSDTSYPGYLDIPKDVMQGYEIMAHEALAAWPDPEPPTHVFLQTGVGGMAAAVAANCWRRFGHRRPMIVLADPVRSACWLETIRHGQPTAVHGDLDTLMAGLACGEVSELAWTILRSSADAVMSVHDEDAIEGMKLLAAGRFGDPPVIAGESAVAGLMACLSASEDPDLRAALRLGSSSSVLVFGTEGATDPDLYERLVGQTPSV